MSGNILGHHSLDVLLVTNGQKPGMLLNTLQCIRQLQITVIWSKCPDSAEFEKSFQNVKYITPWLIKRLQIDFYYELDQNPMTKCLILIM